MKDLFIGIGGAGNQMIDFIKEHVPELETRIVDFRDKKIEKNILESKRVFLFVGLSGKHSEECIQMAERIKELNKIVVAIGALPLCWEGIRRNTRAFEAKDILMTITHHSFFPDNEMLFQKIPKYLPASYLYVPAMEEVLKFVRKLLIPVEDGSTLQNAVVINETIESIGVHSEYEYIMAKFGIRGTDWELELQKLTAKNNRTYDIIEIRLSNDTFKEIYFDITNFYGKS